MNNNPKKASRREMQRRVAAAHQARQADALPGDLEALLVAYEPSGDLGILWPDVTDVFCSTMRASHIRGVESFKKHLSVVAHFLLWRRSLSKSVTFPDTFTQANVDEYYLHGINASDRTRNDYRNRLTNMCRRVNPTADSVLLVPGAPHRSVRPGFSDNDMAKICWAVTRERSPLVRRQLQAVVGLCAGAGLSATDIRYLTAERVIDHDETGIEVRIAGPASRVVWVREDFESLVRAGVSGLRFGDLVVGAKQSRRNVVGNVVDRAALHDCPHFDASRLRSTWLMWLMNQPVALSVIMYAAGLKTARTLVDLLAYQDNADLTDGHVNELRNGRSS